MSEVERVNDIAEQRDTWPAPAGEPRSPLPRLEDLPLAEHGYDPEGVRAAFDSFYRHIAQMDGTLRAIEAVEVFRTQAGELRRELRALKAAGWAPQPLRSAYQARAGRSRGAGMPEALPRIALEAGFLIVVAVLLAAAHFDKLEIVLIMALAWAIVGIVEWAASQERLRLRRPAAPAARAAGATPRAGAESPAALEPGEAAESAGWAAYSQPAERPPDGAEALTVVAPPSDDEAQPAEPEPSAEPVAESPVGAAEPPEAEVAPEPEPVEASAEQEPVAVEVAEAPSAPEPEPEPVAVEAEPEPVAIEAEPELVSVEAEPEPLTAEPDLEPVAAEPEPAAGEPEPEAEPKPAPEPEPAVIADADIEIVGEPDVEIDPEPAVPTWSWGQDAHASPAPTDRRRWLPWRRRSEPESPVVLRPRGHVRVLPPEASADGPVLASEDIDRILDPWEQDFDLSVDESGEAKGAEAADEQPAAAARERDA